MAWKVTRFDTWAELVRWFDSLPPGNSWDMKHVFRGQSDDSWDLDDSLSRIIDLRHVAETIHRPRVYRMAGIS